MIRRRGDERWSMYDRRTGKRATVAAWFTRESAERAIDEARYRSTRSRPDLLSLVDHLEARQVTSDETRG